MAVSRGDFVHFDDQIDPAVRALVGEGKRRKEEASLPPKARRKKAKERKKAEKRYDRRVNWDLTPKLKARIKKIAGEHEVPESQLAIVLLEEALELLAAGQIDLESKKTPSDSPRYMWNLIERN